MATGAAFAHANIPTHRLHSSGHAAPVSLRTTHLPELDALRGMAAFVVLLNHFHELWLGTTHPSWIARPRLNPLLWLLVNGHASVILFFLLSGFVLTLPRLRGSEPSYLEYAVRRICRIYLPYLAALSVSVAACSFFYGTQMYGAAVSASWRLPPDLHSLAQHIMMIGRFNHYRYDGPAWSLVHEMRISLIFPLILFCASRLRAITTFALALACGMAASLSFSLIESGLSGPVRMTAWSWTLSYCGIFLLGSGLARRYEACVDFVDGLGSYRRGALFIGALLLYLYPPSAWHDLDLGDFFIGCGGLVLLTFCLRPTGTLGKLLRLRPAQFLGKISYSLYLLHFPLLLMLSILLYGRVPFGWVLLPYLGLSLLAAAGMYRLIELPSIALGRLMSHFRLPALSGPAWLLQRVRQTQKAHVFDVGFR